jgi:glycosyltransferase involved in cell wall biosynthesis
VKICLIGGIYQKGGGRRDLIEITPETTLEAGLRARGHQVSTLSHYDTADFDSFDVVHVHHLSYGAVRMASSSARVPFVFTAHDTSRMCGLRTGLLHDAAMRYVLSRADAVVALSGREAAFQDGAYRLAGAIHETIPNGIDAERYRFARENTAGQGRPWQLLYVGQLIPLKGVDLLLKALALVPLPVELKLVYQVGALESSLKALAGSLGLLPRVAFLGKRSAAELAALYRASDLLVLPSASEALPSVVSEAMLCGLPFVATARGGIPEQAGGFGFLLDRRSDRDLAAALRHVLENYASFARTGEAMSLRARERFGISRMIQRHLEVYGRVAHSAAPPRRHRRPLAALNTLVRYSLRRREELA